MTRTLIDVNIALLTTSAGGRSGPLMSGYRSLVRFEGSSVDFGFELELEAGATVLRPGEIARGRLSLWAVDELPALSSGLRFEIREGSKVVGHGSIA